MTILGIAWHDIVGNLGVALIVGCYLLVQVGRIRSEDLAYSLGNLAGATLVLVSLTQAFNMAAVVLEATWSLISVYGIWKWWRGGGRAPADGVPGPG